MRRHSASAPLLAALVLAAHGVACSGTSAPPSPAVRLEFVEDPVAGTRGVPLGAVRVMALDAMGRRAASYQGPVTITLRGGQAGAALVGTTSLSGPGSFDFGGVAVDLPGVDYVLAASGPELPEVESHSFSVGTPPQGAAGTWPWIVRVGDLDGDGHLDVVTANFDSQDLSLLRGNGDGTLGATVTLPLGAAPNDLALADLDGDGHLDLVTAHWSAGQVQLRRGRGDGTFWPPARVGASAGSGQVLVADLDGDGKLDLLIATTAGLETLRGRGDGTFQAPVLTAATDLDELALADLDEDGRLDAISGDWLGEALHVRLGDGAGGFGAPSSVPPGQELIFPKSLLVADHDGDGHLDVVVVGSWTDGANVLRGDGTGALAFASSRWMGVGGVGRGQLADLDGDGRPDVVVTDWACTVSVLRHADPNTQHFFTGARAVGLALADMNGDGHLDAVTSNDWFMEPGSVSVLLGNGDGTFQQ